MTTDNAICDSAPGLSRREMLAGSAGLSLAFALGPTPFESGEALAQAAQAGSTPTSPSRATALSPSWRRRRRWDRASTPRCR